MAITGTMSAGDQISWSSADVSVDQTPASSSFIQIESWTTNVTVSGGDTPVSNFNTYDVALVYTGEKNPYTVVVQCAYTEAAATDPFAEIYDDYVASPGLDYDVRWHPQGNSSGNFQFTTSGGKLVNVTIPTQPAASSDPTLFEFTIACSSITRAAV